MWKLTKQYWKDMWVALWSKTTIDEKDRTDDQKAELFRNEGHIVIKMAWTEFVKALSSDQKAKIDALSL